MSEKFNSEISKKYRQLKIGQRLRSLRLANKLSLTELAALTAISEATLSRLENEQTSLSTQHLYALADALGVDIGAFFTPLKQEMLVGSRAVGLLQEREYMKLQHFSSALLCTELQDKKMLPVLNLISAQNIEQAGGLQAHDGEEFLYVLSGEIELHTQSYKPQRLATGDCLYFDAAMAHTYVNVQAEESQILVVNTRAEN
ncbi:MAG: XRE family transcriptional regulator [Oceanospirillaceae bacterium]